MDTHSLFSSRSFVLARLLLEPIYREDESLWEALRDAVVGGLVASTVSLMHCGLHAVR